MREKIMWGFLVACISFGFLGNITQAQIAPGAEHYTIYVENIVLDKTQFKSGDTISGTFDAWNTDTRDIPKFTYKIRLMGDYVNGDPTSVYDEKVADQPFYLASGVRKTVPFTYILPAGIAGDNMGIEIKGMIENGLSLGWSDKQIKISGDTTYLKLNGSSLLIGSTYYPIDLGPTVKEGQVPVAVLQVTNKTKNDLSVIPQISYYNRSIATPVLTTETGTSTTLIKAGETKTITYPLSTLNHVPGVYLGNISLRDTSGAEKLSPVAIRYIIPGDIATIQLVTTSVKTVGTKGPIEAVVTYTGTPTDVIDPESTHDSGNAELSLTLYNEYGQTIASEKDTISLSEAADKKFSFIASHAAKAMRVEAVITKNGKILSEYKEDLSPQYQELAQSNVGSSRLTSAVVVALIALGVLLLLAILAFIIRRRRKAIQSQPFI